VEKAGKSSSKNHMSPNLDHYKQFLLKGD